MQESEQELEQKKQQRAKTMSEYDKIIKTLLANEENNTARIRKTQAEKDALSLITGDTDGSALDDGLRQRIVENTQELYKTAKDLNNNTSAISDQEYQKQISQDTLPMLIEIECLLNNYLENFKEFEEEDEDLFTKVQKDIK